MQTDSSATSRTPGPNAVRKGHELLPFRLEGHPVRLFVRRWLPLVPNGFTVFCVHPVTTTGAHFRFLALYLAQRGYTVISPDLPGHGRSTYFRRPDAYSPTMVTAALIAVTSHYLSSGRERAFIGSSWGAANLCGFLAATRLEAAAVVMTDFPLEWRPEFELTEHFSARKPQAFDSLADAVSYLQARDEEDFCQQDTDEIAPDVLYRHYASRLVQVKGKYLLAFDPCVVTRLTQSVTNKTSYPNFYLAVSKIASAHILLLFGEHSKYRFSDTRDKLVADRANITAIDVERAGHAPRLLSDRQAGLVHDFIERAWAG